MAQAVVAGGRRERVGLFLRDASISFLCLSKEFTFRIPAGDGAGGGGATGGREAKHKGVGLSF